MMENKLNKGHCQIHNVRFYNLSPRSINYLAFNRDLCKLAVLRTDASIEIWDMRHAVYLEKSILGLPQNSIEAIGWATNNRLFSTGRTGELTEWDLKLLKPKHTVLLTGNAACCLDINRAGDLIAVGTDEGYLNIFQADEYGGLNYVKIFDKQEGRISCCKFDHTGDILVTGSEDAIRIWDVKTGHAIHRMTVGRIEKKRETIVWSIKVLKDLTIISGDSRGRITIWDGKLGTQIESFAALKADVLAVAVNDDETMFSCSGIDPIIKIFTLTPIKKDNQIQNKWIKCIQRSVHDHDVMALEFIDSKIVSGGIDGYLGISATAKLSSSFSSGLSKLSLTTKYGPFLAQPCAIVSEQNRLLLLKYFNYLELWQLGTPSQNVQLTDDETDKGQFLSLDKRLEKLLELRSIADEPILSTTISNDGNWLIYSSELSIRVFRLSMTQNGKPILNRIKDLPIQFTPSNHIIFSNNSKELFLVKSNNSIDIFSITDDDEFNYQDTIDTSKVIKNTMTIIKLSKCGKYLVCVGACCCIAVFTTKTTKKSKSNSWKHYLNLPKYHLTPTAIEIHQNRPLLVAAFSDSKIFEYDLDEMHFTCSSNKKFVTNADTHAINNIVLDPNNENILLLHNDTYLFVLEKVYRSKNAPKSPTSNKRLKSKKHNGNNDDNDDEDGDDSSSEDEVASFKLKFTKPYEHFVHLSWLSNSEMVAVGVNPVTLIEQLPPTMRQKKFGAA